MKFESFRLCDLSVKGEGNLHVVVLNNKSGQVFIFPKESKKCINPATDCDLSNVDINKLYKIAINYKKYVVFQKFWGKNYLPKMRVCLFPKQIIELVANYVETQRLDSRKTKSIITRTSLIEVQPDLSILPIEYDFFTSGNTYCVELKTKFGILFQPKDQPLDCRNKMCRYCISQVKKSLNNRTNYCPCDMFSGNFQRFTRAIKNLIHCPQDKLRIFQNGTIANNIDNQLICNFVDDLFQQKHIGYEQSFENFCQLLFQSLTYDVSGKNQSVKLPENITTNCQAHSWSTDESLSYIDDVLKIPSGSVLGSLIKTNSIVYKKTEEMYELYLKLKEFLHENGIEVTENIFDLWNEYLLPLDLPSDIIEIVKMLKKYLVCLTARDCSIMIKFKRASVDKLCGKHSNAVILKQSNESKILVMADVIDISIKPISKIKSNYEYEKELITDLVH